VHVLLQSITSWTVVLLYHKKTPWSEPASELYRPSDHRLSEKLVPTFAWQIPRLKPLLFFQIAPQLYSRGWVDPVPDPLLLRKSGSAGNPTQASGSVVKNSDQYITRYLNTPTLINTLPQNSRRWPLCKSANVGIAVWNISERYLQEGLIWVPLWQWHSPRLTEIDAHVAFPSSGKEQEIAWWYKVSIRGCGKTVTCCFASSS
jgi:hypothetical protein